MDKGTKGGFFVFSFCGSSLQAKPALCLSWAIQATDNAVVVGFRMTLRTGFSSVFRTAGVVDGGLVECLVVLIPIINLMGFIVTVETHLWM